MAGLVERLGEMAEYSFGGGEVLLVPCNRAAETRSEAKSPERKSISPKWHHIRILGPFAKCGTMSILMAGRERVNWR